jgi:hypothetical protein
MVPLEVVSQSSTPRVSWHLLEVEPIEIVLLYEIQAFFDEGGAVLCGSECSREVFASSPASDRDHGFDTLNPM